MRGGHYDFLDSEPFSSDACSDSWCTVIDFYFLLHAAYFWFFLTMFLSFQETNLSNAEKASVKDEGRLLTDCAYED